MPTTQTLAGFGFATAAGLSLKETTYGTAVTPSAYLPFTSNQFTLTNKLIKHQAVRQSKGQQFPALGQVELKGNLEVEVDPNSIGALLGYTFGADTVTNPATGVYLHNFVMSQPLNSFTLSNDYAKGVVHQFTGCKIDTVDFSAKPDGYLMAKFGIIGQNDVPLTSSSLSPTFGTIQSFSFEQFATCSINSTQTPINGFSISMKNNLKPYYGSGSARLVRNINETQAQITGSFTTSYENDVIANYVISGTPVNIQFSFQSTSIIQGANPYYINFVMPNCLMEAAPLDPKLADPTMYSVKFSCYESSVGAQNDLTVLLQNTIASSYVS